MNITILKIGIANLSDLEINSPMKAIKKGNCNKFPTVKPPSATSFESLSTSVSSVSSPSPVVSKRMTFQKKMMEMAEADNDEKLVYVNIEFAKIGEIDTMNEKYYADLLIHISWTDNSVIEKYDKDKHWNPNIYIENLLIKSKESIEYEVKGVSESSTEIILKWEIKVC